MCLYRFQSILSPIFKKGAMIMIMTLNEACNVLHVDMGNNDELITGLLLAMPDYIETATGFPVSEMANEPLVKTCCNFLLILWYHADHSDDAKLQRTIDNLLKCITLKAKEYAYERVCENLL